MKVNPTFLMYNHGGSQNHGCEAIVRSTADLLKDKWPGSRVELCSLDASQDVGIDGIDRVLSHGVKPYSADRLINSFAARLGSSQASQQVRINMPFIRAARKADICLSIGGDTYCYKLPKMLMAVNEKLKAQGTKMVLWGCSVEPDLLCGELLDDISRYDLIVARESITYQAMCSKNLPVIRWPDPAFALKRQEVSLPMGWLDGNTVGLNVSPLILKNAKNGENTLHAFIKLVRHILDHTTYAVALIPHVTWAHDDDREALGAIKKEFRSEARVFVLPDSYNASQLKYLIGKLNLLVTARTHASVAGYSSGVPTLVIGYSIKARGIARDLFGEEAGHLLPVQEMDSAASLIGAFETLAKNAQSERTFLAGRIPQYTQGRDDVLARLEALIP